MARIAGVTTQKDTKGNLTHVTINLKKHKAVLPLLEQMGVIEKSELQKMMDSGKWFTIEEARAHTHEFIKKLPWKK